MIYQNNYIYIEIEKSEIPWLKIFTKEPYKEFSECDRKTKKHLLLALDVIEKEMIKFYSPKKINIVSLGNYVPKVHFHIMARFENDSYFPEPMWGKKQREADLDLPNMNIFLDNLKKSLIKVI